MTSNQAIDHNSSQPYISTWNPPFRLPHRLSNGPKWSNGDQTRRAAKAGRAPGGHSSPRGVERRRTTTCVRHRPTSDSHIYPTVNEQVAGTPFGNYPKRARSGRPVSWHPSSHLASMPEHGSFSTMEHQPALSAPIFDPSIHQTVYNPNSYFALPTRHSQTSFMDFNLMNSAICELERNNPSVFYPQVSNQQFMQPQTYLAAPTSSNGVPLGQEMYTYAHPQEWCYAGPIAQDAFSTLPSESYVAPAPFEQMAPGYAEQQILNDPEKELVGMGLYDAPEKIATTAAQLRGNRFSMTSDTAHSDGKGLKLEETWQPPGKHEPQGQGSDDESSEEELDEVLPPASQPQTTYMHGMQYDVPVDLSGHSFFFEDEAAVGNEWWYDQLKQPTAHNAGIGYGWL